MKQKTKAVAFGGMMTAVAVVIMSLGSIIPVNTFLCPVLCILLAKPVMEVCGKRLGWCYYIAVSFLGMLLSPDREAAVVYVLMGHYPMIKPWMDRLKPQLFWKSLLFGAVGWAEFAVAMYVLGVSDLETGILAWVTLAVWIVLFVMVDRLLGMKFRKRGRYG